MESAGAIAERPWGWRLARVVLSGATGQVTLDAHDKRYCIAFDRGAIIGASSPVAADSAARIALAFHAITPAQLAEVGRRLTAAPERDEIELVCEVATLPLDQAERLRRRVIVQRVARTFGLETGTWATTDRIRVPVVRGISVDVRAAVYLGARGFMTDDRLALDVIKLGTHFTLRPEAADDLAAYGFGETERAVIRALRSGTSLAELEATHREVDARTLQAIIYALAACEALTCVTVARTPSPANVLFRQRTPTADRPILARTQSPQQPQLARTLSPQQPQLARTQSPQQPQLARTLSPQQPKRLPTGPYKAIVHTPGQSTIVRSSTGPYPAVSRAPSPQQPVVARTKSPTLPITARTATGSPIARVKTGRLPTAPITARAPIASKPAADDPVQASRLAGEAFARGERALAAEQLDAAIPELARASELAPTNVDYAAALAWAKFCRASDKQAAAIETRRALDRAVYKSSRPATALFWLGRMERIVGRDRQALRHFQEVLALQPSNEGVATEIRILEARIARDSRR